MPRLPASLLRKARAIDPLLPVLLPPCRDLGAAQNELRWLREHVQEHAKARDNKEQATLLRKLVNDRASGKPLQYILGTEYFGDLEIQCRPEVLIPRQETAASVTHLARLLQRAQELPSELRVLDLCTGTGCIPLLFHHEFTSAHREVSLKLLGVDISQKAIDLACHNRERVRKMENHKIEILPQFLRADVLTDPLEDQAMDPPCLPTALRFHGWPQFWDILISNPPYISPTEFWNTTTRSVREFEPKLALVPPPRNGLNDVQQGDRFYPRLLDIVRDVEAKICLFEVADQDQALRVARMARELGIFQGIEIWRDKPDLTPDSGSSAAPASDEFPIVGTGNGRSVFCYRSAGAAWLGRKVEPVKFTLGHVRYGSGYEKTCVVRDDGKGTATRDLKSSFSPRYLDRQPDTNGGFPLRKRYPRNFSYLRDFADSSGQT